MKSRYFSILAGLLALMTCLVIRFRWREWPRNGGPRTAELAAPKPSDGSNANGLIEHSISSKVTAARLDENAGAILASTNNRATLTYSNIVVASEYVPGPLDDLIGGAEYERMAKKDFESNVSGDKALAKIKKILESEGAVPDHIYSAVRVVYEMRTDQSDFRQEGAELRRKLNESLAEIQSDKTLSEADKSLLSQNALNETNAQLLSLDSDAKRIIERTMAKLRILTVGIGEEAFERLCGLELTFHARPLQPE